MHSLLYVLSQCVYFYVCAIAVALVCTYNDNEVNSDSTMMHNKEHTEQKDPHVNPALQISLFFYLQIRVIKLRAPQ